MEDYGCHANKSFPRLFTTRGNSPILVDVKGKQAHYQNNHKAMTTTTYQVIQHNEWCCPGMLIFVDERQNIVGQQQNPDNALTQQWAEDDEDWGIFDPSNYKSVTKI